MLLYWDVFIQESKLCICACETNKFAWNCKGEGLEGIIHPLECIILSGLVTPDVLSHGECYHSYSFKRSSALVSLRRHKIITFLSCERCLSGVKGNTYV